ncbi:MAG: Ig-like domain-containing protein [Oscillospiraceae bacterium]|nr:Ig-like domain-containing protein [Oscillospiraceae bacterium]
MNRRIMKSLLASLIAVFMMTSIVNPNVFAEEPVDGNSIQENEDNVVLTEPEVPESTEPEGDSDPEEPAVIPDHTEGASAPDASEPEEINPAPETEEVNSEAEEQEDNSEALSYDEEEQNPDEEGSVAEEFIAEEGSQAFAIVTNEDGTIVETVSADDLAVTEAGAIPAFPAGSSFGATSGVVVDTGKKDVDIDGTTVTITNRIKLAKTPGATNKNSITFTVKDGYEADLTVYAISSNGSAGASLNVFDSDGTALFDGATMPGSTGQKVSPFVFEDIAAGDYYLASYEPDPMKPANIYYLVLSQKPAKKETKTFAVNVDDVPETYDPELVPFFSWNSTVVRDSNTKTFIVDDTEITVKNRLKLGKKVGSSAEGSIHFTVEEGYKATIELYAISGNDNNTASLALFTSLGEQIGENAVIPRSSQGVQKVVFEEIEAGDYYVACNDKDMNSANLYYLKAIEEDAGSEDEPKKDWAEVAPPQVTAELTEDDAKNPVIRIGYKMVIGTEGADALVVTVKKPDGTDATAVSDKKDNDGSAFVYANYRPDASGDYVIIAAGKREGEADKTATASVTGFLLPLGTAKPVVLPGDASAEVSWDAIPEASAYEAIVYQNGVEVKKIEGLTEPKVTITELENDTEYGFVVVTHRNSETDNQTISEEVKATPKAPEEGVEWFIANRLDPQTVSGEVLYPDNTNYAVLNGVAIQTCDPVVASDGTIFNKRLSAGAPSKDPETGAFLPQNGKAYRMTFTELSSISVYCKSSGDAERNLRIADSDGKTISDITAAGKAAPLAPSTMVTLEPGTYYLYSTNSTVYLFGVKIIAGEAPRKDWDEVPAPVINSVERLEDGSFEVDFTAEFGDDGADGGRVFMFQNGFEVSSTAVTTSESVKFMPAGNGDYVFKVIISRANCPDKESEEYKYENYILPPTAPAITWLNNLGSGSVYVDWINVDADQGCTLSYKVKGDEEFTVVEEGNTKGKATIKGLTAGKTYVVRVTAKDTMSGDSSYDREITVGNPVQEWYVDDFGSATSGVISVNGMPVNVKSYDSLYPISKNHVPDVTDGSGEIMMSLGGSSKNGKIADSEEGIQVYYTRLDPNTENFKLTATFEYVDSPAEYDNQSGFGIYAIDTAGLGTKDAKYMNSVAVGNFKLSGGPGVTLYHGNGVRVVTGYTSYDPTSTDGTGRVLDNTNLFTVQPSDTSKMIPGQQFTYTLTKTSSGFTASMDGDSNTIRIPDVTKIMQQEDGSIVVAVASARCDVKVTGISFEKTKGSVDGGGTTVKIEPKLSVYSSAQTTSPAYEFMGSTNVPGELAIYRVDVVNDTEKETLIAEKIPTETDIVFKLPIELWNVNGENQLRYKFKPDRNTPDLTSYSTIRGDLKVNWMVRGAEGDVIYTAPLARENGLGTREDPVDLQTALYGALPGQMIVMLDGTYAPTADLMIPRNVSGSVDQMITLKAEHTGKVKVTGDNLVKSSSLFTIVGSYWHIFGIEFCDTPGKGVSVCGNCNTVEMCVMHNTGNSGLQISRFSGEPNDKEMWPSYNLIKNCESYDNCDPGRNDADGFAAKLTCGEGNKFYGCISHHNIDDGWDLYAKSTTGEIGTVVIENSVAYSNGWLTTDDPNDPATEFGEGNGFKLGGENMYGGHQLINSVSFNNKAKGITSNSCPDNEIYNCTVYNNSIKGKSYNVSLYTKSSNIKAWKASGVLSVATNGTTEKELGASNGVIYSLRSESNYFFDGNSSFNTQGVEATEDWFENVDVTVAPTRNEDGTINMHGLLVLKNGTPEDTGARLNTSGEAISPVPTSHGTEPVRLVRYTVSDTLSEDNLTDPVVSLIGGNTVAKLKSFLLNSVKSGAVTMDKAAAYDVAVEVSYDDGATWVPTTESTFPTEGIDIVFAYPSGTGLEGWSFAASHISVMSINGSKAGTIEYPAVEPKEDGLHVHANSASPFALGWKKTDSALISVTLPDAPASVLVGDTVRLTPTYNPDTEAVKGVTFLSDHPDIIAVNNAGDITAKAPGTAKITVISAQNPQIYATVEIEAKAIAVEAISTAPEIIMYVGDSMHLETEFVPANATNRTMFYDSAGPKIVDVDKRGNLTALSEGEAEIAIESEDGRKSSITKVIVKKNGIYAEGIAESYDYIGSAIKPQVLVYDRDKLLTENKDYKISYKNNTKAAKSGSSNAPTVVITGTGNYKEKQEVKFTINPIDLSRTEADVITVEAKANAKSVSISPKLYWNGKALSAGKDYEKKTSLALEEGKTEYEETIRAYTGGNFKGTKTIKIHVVYKGGDLVPVSKLKVTAKAVPYESGMSFDTVKEKCSLVVKDGSDKLSDEGDNPAYEVLKNEDSDCTEAGTCRFRIHGLGKYSGERTVAVKITGTSISSAKVEGNVIYDGNPKLLDGLTVYVGSGKNRQNLEPGKDYEIDVYSYQKNINAGNASVMIRGINGFSGEKRVTFKILTNTDAARKTVEVKDAFYSKGGAVPEIIIEFKDDEENVIRLKEGTDYSVKFTNNKAIAGKDDAKAPKAKITYLGNFKNSDPKEVTFNILPKDLTEVYAAAADPIWKSSANNFKAKVSLTDQDGKTLQLNKDYTVDYTYVDGSPVPEKTKAGAGEMFRAVITAKEGSGYTGSITIPFRMISSPENLAKATITIAGQEYTGEPVIPNADAITAVIGKTKTKLRFGRSANDDCDFYLIGVVNNTKKGTAKAIFAGKGDYAGTKTVNFKIVQKNVPNHWRFG